MTATNEEEVLLEAKPEKPPALRLGIEMILRLPPEMLAIPVSQREAWGLPRAFVEQKDRFVFEATLMEQEIRRATPPWEDPEERLSDFYARLRERLVETSRAERAATGETRRDLSPRALLEAEAPRVGLRLVPKAKEETP